MDRKVKLSCDCPYCLNRINIIYDKDMPEDTYLTKEEEVDN